ncbi:MAG: hypothetical protein V1720_03600 [bacterium]
MKTVKSALAADSMPKQATLASASKGSVETPKFSTNSIYSTLGPLPKGLSSLHKKITTTESRLKDLDEQISTVRDKLKPIPRLDRKRGQSHDVVGGDRKFLKASLKRLEHKRFVEADAWTNLMSKFNNVVKTDVVRVKSNFTKEKAKSIRYLRKNTQVVVNQTKSFFDYLLNEDVDQLEELKTNLRQLRDEKLVEYIKAFLPKYDEASFISAAYISHRDYRGKFHVLFSDLLVSWNPKSKKAFSFKDVEIKFSLAKEVKK